MSNAFISYCPQWLVKPLWAFSFVTAGSLDADPAHYIGTTSSEDNPTLVVESFHVQTLTRDTYGCSRVFDRKTLFFYWDITHALL